MMTINDYLTHRLKSLSRNSIYGFNATPLQEVEFLEEIFVSRPELAQQVMKIENSIKSTNFVVHGKKLYENSI